MSKDTITMIVRFSDVDATGVVWHGNYLHYLEVAREEYCRRRGFDYRRMLSDGIEAPIVDLKVRYMKPAQMGDNIVVNIHRAKTHGAKLTFDYEIRNENGDTLLIARTIQLFTDCDGNLLVEQPQFLSML